MDDAPGTERSAPTLSRPGATTTTDAQAGGVALDGTSRPVPPSDVSRTRMPVDTGLASFQPRWRTRRIVFLAVAVVAVIGALAGYHYWRVNAGFVRTDNARTAGDLAPIS